MLIGGWSLVLIVGASILVIHVGSSWLPWSLPVFLDWGLFVSTVCIVIFVAVSMSGTIVCDLKPGLPFAVSLSDFNIRRSGSLC